MTVIDRIDAARRERDVLRHPFYVRWAQGKLSRRELADYAGEYRNAVEALAVAAEQAAPLAGSPHADEERTHVALWDDFARAAGADAGATPREETQRCVAAWTTASDPLDALAVLYAIEAGQPEVSRTKLAGLVEHYGFEPGTRATAYFELHAVRDRKHAEESRALLERHARPEDGDCLVAVADAALAGNWTLLDGVPAAP